MKDPFSIENLERALKESTEDQQKVLDSMARAQLRADAWLIAAAVGYIAFWTLIAGIALHFLFK